MENKKFFWTFFAIWFIILTVALVNHFTSKMKYYEDYEVICQGEYNELMCTVLAHYDVSNSSIVKVEDDYGDSYIYTGNVDNNYIEFADKMWRIVRLNGNGSMRLIYTGEIGSSYTKQDSVIDMGVYSDLIDNTAVGYMHGKSDDVIKSTTLQEELIKKSKILSLSKYYQYDTKKNSFVLGDSTEVSVLEMYENRLDYIGQYYLDKDSSILYQVADIVEEGKDYYLRYYKISVTASSPSQAQQNDLNSKVKNTVDAWYKNNLANSDYEKYLIDTTFCGDRSINLNAPKEYSNKAYSFENTLYYKYEYNDLICDVKNDRYTVLDNSVGNHALSYKIGLLSVEEISLAGMTEEKQTEHYLNSQIDYWTMSPYRFYDMTPSVFTVSSDGKISDADTATSLGIRPVINISLSLKLSGGNGTIGNPYQLNYN